MSAHLIRIMKFVPVIAAVALGVSSEPAARDAAAPDETSTRVIEVEVKDFSFTPDTLRIAPGASVRWVNRDQVGHTSTADGGEWESPLLGPGESFVQRFAEEGTYAYHCTPHPFMRGVVIVEN